MSKQKKSGLGHHSFFEIAGDFILLPQFFDCVRAQTEVDFHINQSSFGYFAGRLREKDFVRH